MSSAIVKVAPGDNGKRMSLDDFDRAEALEGYLYELGRGVIVVSDVPGRRHLAQVNEIRLQLTAYWVANRATIHTIAGGSDCKILLPALQSERHPDIAVYKTSPDSHDDETLWQTWVPEIIIEVVSPGSEQRDYGDKRDEYLSFGVREYWIFDGERQEMLVHKRRGNRWREQRFRPPEQYSTRLLPGFTLEVAAVLAAAARLPE